MPSYEYRCRSCGDTFTVRRPMDATEQPAHCPQGHDDTTRLFTTLGLRSVSSAVSAPACPASMPAGGCCGGGCG